MGMQLIWFFYGNEIERFYWNQKVHTLSTVWRNVRILFNEQGFGDALSSVSIVLKTPGDHVSTFDTQIFYLDTFYTSVSQ